MSRRRTESPRALSTGAILSASARESGLPETGEQQAAAGVGTASTIDILRYLHVYISERKDTVHTCPYLIKGHNSITICQ
ncbi:hypothetical protein SAT01_22510 [Sinomonas atrocyanea]|nr:hypothetical protein SAT01_22510 [Sinomonas atrocyanea]GGG55409.1 hypothetical protein GCM10007172_02980 [Sinomonas atrocyanea]